MRIPFRGAICCLPPMAALLMSGGCAEEKAATPADKAPPAASETPTPSAPARATDAVPGPQGPVVAGPGPAGMAGPGPGGPGGKSSPELKKIMTRLAKGPNSLTPVLGNALKADAPAWDAIRGQTKEYAQLASEMGKYDPPKGSKDSWEKLTSAYAGLATDLDTAAQAKDKDAALAAHGQITKSCNSCHQQHRMMGPGMGGPRGGGGGPGRGGPGGTGGGPPG